MSSRPSTSRRRRRARTPPSRARRPPTADGTQTPPATTRERSNSDGGGDVPISMGSMLPTIDLDAKHKEEKRKNNVTVVCRFRPENKQERERGSCICVDFENDGKGVTLETDKGLNRFNFDRTFRPFETQEDVYEEVGSPVVKSVIEGYNAAIIAYGQTGSGKTYTMMGPGFDSKKQMDAKDYVEPGLIPRVMQQLFAHAAEIQSNVIEVRMRASYIEIYNENFRDLLSPNDGKKEPKLKLRNDEIRGLYLPDAVTVPIQELTDVFATLRLGARKRVTASTDSNKHSSRSHAIFLVVLEVENALTHEINVSQLYLVDLAGSEKVAKTNAHGDRLREAQNINQSLSALGLVIFALAGAQKKKRAFIPYRNSKLTRLLQNCLGGNARTTLIINASPSDYNAEESLSTLRFGERTQRIKNTAKINKVLSYAELKVLHRQHKKQIAAQARTIRELQNEIHILKQMQAFESARQAAGLGYDPSEMLIRSSSMQHLDEEKDEKKKHHNENSDSDSDEEDLIALGMRPMEVPGTNFSNSGKQVNGPGVRELIMHFLCPISKQIMTDPVFATDGYSYERIHLENYLRTHTISPMTGGRISKTIFPNHNLKIQIQRYYPNVPVNQLVDYWTVVPVITIKMEILPYSSYKDLARLSVTCKDLYDFTSAHRLWKHLLINDFPQHYSSANPPKVDPNYPVLKLRYKADRLEMQGKVISERTKEKKIKTNAVLGTVVVENLGA